MEMRIGVIDVGSNTTRLLVASADAGRSRPARDAEGAPLARRGDRAARRRLRRPRRGRREGGRARWRARARRERVDSLDVFLTAPGRQAGNAAELVAALSRAAGVPARVLTKEEEGTLAYRGAVLTRGHRPAGAGRRLRHRRRLDGDRRREPGPRPRLDRVRRSRLRPPHHPRRATCTPRPRTRSPTSIPPTVEAALAVGGSARAARRLVGAELGETELAEALRIVETTSPREVARPLRRRPRARRDPPGRRHPARRGAAEARRHAARLRRRHPRGRRPRLARSARRVALTAPESRARPRRPRARQRRALLQAAADERLDDVAVRAADDAVLPQQLGRGAPFALGEPLVLLQRQRRARRPAARPSGRSGRTGSRRRGARRTAAAARREPPTGAARARRAGADGRRRSQSSRCAGGGVPEQDARHRRSSSGRSRDQLRTSAARLRASPSGSRRPRRAAANSPSSGAHPPVADDLRPALGVDVARLADLLQELAAEAGLLLDLAQGARLVGLALVALALREAPVVVLRPVHEQHLPVAHDETAGGADDRQIVLRSFCPRLRPGRPRFRAALLLALDETAGGERLLGRRSGGELTQPLARRPPRPGARRGRPAASWPAARAPSGPRARPRSARACPSSAPRAAPRRPARRAACWTALRSLGERPVGELVERHRRPRSARARRSSARCRRAARGTAPSAARASRRAAAAGALGAQGREQRPRLPRVLAAELAASASRRARRTSRSRTSPSTAPSCFRRPSSSACRSRSSLLPARSSARRRRTATRMSWRLSGSRPSRVPGSCRSISRSCSRRTAAQLLERRARGLRPCPRVGRSSRLRARPPRARPRSSRARRAAVAKLDLHLDEVVHARGVQHRHLVRGHLGRRPVARDELAAPLRAQLGDALERPAAQVSLEQLRNEPRRLPRTALGLELEARVVGGELQLPDVRPRSVRRRSVIPAAASDPPGTS